MNGRKQNQSLIRILRRCAYCATQLLLATQPRRPVHVRAMRECSNNNDIRHMEKPQTVYSEFTMKVTDDLDLHMTIKELLTTPIDVRLQLRQKVQEEHTSITKVIELTSAEQIRSLYEALQATVSKLDILQGIQQPSQPVYYPPTDPLNLATVGIQRQIVRDKHGKTQIVEGPPASLVRTANSFNREVPPEEPLELHLEVPDDDSTSDAFETVHGQTIDG